VALQRWGMAGIGGCEIAVKLGQQTWRKERGLAFRELAKKESRSLAAEIAQNNVVQCESVEYLEIGTPEKAQNPISSHLSIACADTFIMVTLIRFRKRSCIYSRDVNEKNSFAVICFLISRSRSVDSTTARTQKKVEDPMCWSRSS
jgi:hypothetical protein